MAEISRFWTTNGTGDGAAGGYTQAQFAEFVRQTLMTSLTTEGVLKGIGNELAVSGTSSPLTVASGSGLVYGFLYANDAPITTGSEVTIPTPTTATRIDRIVLRASWSAQTIRVFRIAGTEGLGAPALTQVANTTWDIPLASVSITTGGVITITDARTFVKTPGTYGYLDDANIIAATQLSTSAVTTTKIADLNVTTAKIADANVTTVKIADANVTEAKIATGAVTETKLGTGSVTVTKIGAGAVTAAKMATDSVAAASIIANAVTEAKINAGAVTADKIGAGAVTNSKLGAGAVTGAKIDTNTVSGGLTGNIALTTITADNIANDAVTEAKILNGAVNNPKLASNSVTTVKILDANVTADKLATNSVIEAKINAGAVTNAKLGASAVTSDKIASLTIAAGNIAANAVTNAKIIDDAITSAKIADSAVVTASIANGAISSDKLATSSVTSGKIYPGAVNGSALGDYAIRFGGRQGGDSNSWSTPGTTSYETISLTYGNDVLMVSGSIQISLSSASSGTANVTFVDYATAGVAFASNPIVVTTSNGSPDYILDISAISTSGATIRATHKAGTSATTTITAWWICVGTTAI